MKKILSAALCAVLLLGLLSPVAPPAEAITAAGVTVNTYTAYVGDSFTWTVYGPINLVDPHICDWEIYAGDISVSNASSDGFYCSFTAPYAGVFSARVIITDQTPDHMVIYSPSVIVSLRPAPKITKIEAMGGTSLKLTWSKVPGASGYEVWRSTSKTGTYTKIKETTGTSFINTYRAPGTRYFYKVRCYNLIGVTKMFSGYFSAVAAGVPLAKPAALSASVRSGSSVKLSWNAVTGATGYELWRSTSAAGTYARVYRGTARTFTNTALKTGKLYYYKVRAYKKIGTTYYCGPLSAYRAVRPL